jgi:hypothetical protein
MLCFLHNTFPRAHPFGPGLGIRCSRRLEPWPFTHSTYHNLQTLRRHQCGLRVGTWMRQQYGRFGINFLPPSSEWKLTPHLEAKGGNFLKRYFPPTNMCGFTTYKTLIFSPHVGWFKLTAITHLISFYLCLVYKTKSYYYYYYYYIRLSVMY